MTRKIYKVTMLEGMRLRLLQALHEIRGISVLGGGYTDGSTGWQILVESDNDAQSLENSIRKKLCWGGWLVVEELTE